MDARTDYIVVKHLQAAGHVTGMTGDGVNDAPALRQAEVGIAVSTATDVAKGAASVVLTAPGLTNIVALVEQGRTIYQRVLTWIVNKISRTILKAAFVAIAFNVRPSRKPETWNIGGFITVSVVRSQLACASIEAGLVTTSRLVFSYGQCGGPLVHGTNLSDAGHKSACGPSLLHQVSSSPSLSFTAWLSLCLQPR